MTGQAPSCLPTQTRHLGGLWAPSWASEGYIFLVWPLGQTPGSSLAGLPARLGRELGRSLRPVGVPPAVSLPC